MKLNRLFYVSLGFIISFYTTTAVAALVAPSELKAAASSSSQISLSWSDNSGNESGFILQRSLQASSGFMQIATLPAQSKSFIDSSLKAGTTYYYRVRAYKMSRRQTESYSSFSNIAQVMTPSGAPSPTPTPKPTASPTPALTPTPTPTPVASNPNDVCPYLTLEQQRYPGATVINAKTTYGLVGDGMTDEYDALQKVSTAISGKQFTSRMIVYFPKGNYYINRFIRPQGTGANNNKAVSYSNASNFSLIGCTGAVVSVKGDFEMTNDFTAGGDYGSYSMQMNPFRFESSSNFKLSGFEINGNGDKLTRKKPGSLGETFSHGIVTAAAKNYELSHIKVHHFAGDGVYVGDSPTVDDTATYDDIESYNNARQGMSIIEARNLIIKNSTFRDTGITGGSAPSYAPSAGVDIEPNWGPPEGSLMTGNIVFDNCHFLNNVGSQWVGGDNGINIENVTIRNSEIVSRPENTHPYVIIMSLPGGVIENNKITTYSGGVYPSYSEGKGDLRVVNTLVRGNTIYSSDVGLQAIDNGTQIVIENNTFISTGSQGPFPNITAGVKSFTGNKITYPSKDFGSQGVVGSILTPTFTDNTITTDLTSGNYTVRVSPGTSAANNNIGPHILLSP